MLKNVKDFDSINTSSKQYILMICLEYVIEGNEAGNEGEDVMQLVMNYKAVRSDCLNFRNVYRLLGKQQLLADNTKLLDATQIPQIGKDLEERNKQTTLE